MNESIRRLQKLIAAEEEKIRNCQHTFGEPYSNPEEVREPYGSRLEHQGSDCWSVPEGYRDITKPRWTKKCTKCGYELHTYQTEPIVTGVRPKFI